MKTRYLVAVSGGSDSMALLNMSYNKGYHLVVAHVNYGQRESALRDQMIVEKYCQERNIKIYIDKPKYIEGNFQAWARDERYRFFKEIVEQENCVSVLVGHHFEDLLETYLIQKKRKTVPLFWGLNEETEINGLKIFRPLLNYHKDDLISYCESNGLEYGEDESNRSSKYLRNKIRNEELSKYDKKSLINEINDLNKQLADFNTLVENTLVTLKDVVTIEEFNKIDENIKKEVLRQWLILQGVDSRHYSIKKIDNILVFISSFGNKNVKLNLSKALHLEYGCFYVDDINVEYRYTIEKLENLETLYFKIIVNKGKGIRLDKTDFPITIRNYCPGDSIRLKVGTKQVRRVFIDHKILTKDRKRWPIVLNKDDEIVLVPKLATNVKYISNNPNFFMVE